jgi:hypothetical protein
MSACGLLQDDEIYNEINQDDLVKCFDLTDMCGLPLWIASQNQWTVNDPSILDAQSIASLDCNKLLFDTEPINAPVCPKSPVSVSSVSPCNNETSICRQIQTVPVLPYLPALSSMVLDAHIHENHKRLVPDLTSIEQITETANMLLRLSPQQRLYYQMCAYISYMEWVINWVLYIKKQEKQKKTTKEKILTLSLFPRVSYELKQCPVANALLQTCVRSMSMPGFQARSKIIVSLINQQPPYMRKKLKRAQQLLGAVNKKRRQIAKHVGVTVPTSTSETKPNTVEEFIEDTPHIRHSKQHTRSNVQLRIDMKHIVVTFEYFVQPHEHQPARVIEDGLCMFM